MLAVRTAVVTGVVLLVGGTALTFWRYPAVPFLVFLAILAGVFLDAASAPLRTRVGLSRGLSVTLVAAVGLGLGLTFLVSWGPQLSSQAADFVEQLPGTIERLEDFLREHAWLRESAEGSAGWDAARLKESVGTLWGPFARLLSATSAAASAALVVASAGFFLALSPGVYTGALRSLFPRSLHPRFDELLADSSRALRWWLLGRLASMAVVGIMTVVGLVLLGAPYPFLLGLVAAALCFIPYLGPILATVPAFLVGVAEEPRLGLWIVLLYIGIQLVEGHSLTPLIQKRTVFLPPAALIFSQVTFGLFFGLLGILVATPLTVALVVLVQKLYINGVLHEDVRVLGDHDG